MVDPTSSRFAETDKHSIIPNNLNNMVSTLEAYKHFPQHIKHLLSDLHSGGDLISILSSYIPCLKSDLSLYYIYLNFGYSPEHGSFLSLPQVSDLISCICKEYHASIPEAEDRCSKVISDMRKEFLSTFYAYDLQELVDPAELDLMEFSEAKQESLQSLWCDFTPQNGTSSLTIPSELNTARINKGLKILSKKIREILISRGDISYKEISELVVTEMESMKELDREKEGKNILRRIYDSLNVLEASGVVGKNDKKYYWKGLPTSQVEFQDNIAVNICNAKEKVEGKRESLRELCKRFYSLRELLIRNSKIEKHSEKIDFPFIVVGTEENQMNKVSNIQVIIESNQRHTDVALKFYKEIILFGDIDILIHMGMYQRPMYSTDIPIDLFESLACKMPTSLAGYPMLFQDKSSTRFH